MIEVANQYLPLPDLGDVLTLLWTASASKAELQERMDVARDAAHERRGATVVDFARALSGDAPASRPPRPMTDEEQIKAWRMAALDRSEPLEKQQDARAQLRQRGLFVRGKNGGPGVQPLPDGQFIDLRDRWIAFVWSLRRETPDRAKFIDLARKKFGIWFYCSRFSDENFFEILFATITARKKGERKRGLVERFAESIDVMFTKTDGVTYRREDGFRVRVSDGATKVTAIRTRMKTTKKKTGENEKSEVRISPAEIADHIMAAFAKETCGAVVADSWSEAHAAVAKKTERARKSASFTSSGDDDPDLANVPRVGPTT